MLARDKLILELNTSLSQLPEQEFIDQIGLQDTNQTYKQVEALLDKERNVSGWKELYAAYQKTLDLWKSPSKAREELGKLITEAVEASVALSLDTEEELRSASLLVCLIKGLNKKYKKLDQENGLSLKAFAVRTTTQLLIKFTGKNRQDNLKPILDAIEILHGKIRDLRPQPGLAVPEAEEKFLFEEAREAHNFDEEKEQKNEINETEESDSDHESISESKSEESDADELEEGEEIRRNSNNELYLFKAWISRIEAYKAKYAFIREEMSEVLNDVQIERIDSDQFYTIICGFYDKLEDLEGILEYNFDFISKFQEFFRQRENDREYRDLFEFEQKIKDSIEQDAVIIYDQKYAQQYGLERDLEDAWRQASFVQYQADTVAGIFNKGRNIGGKISAYIPGLSLFGAVVRTVVPGGQAVLGSAASPKAAMSFLLEKVEEAKDKRIEELEALNKLFIEAKQSGEELKTGIYHLKNGIKQKVNNQELAMFKETISDLKLKIDRFIRVNEGIIRCFLRKIFGLGACEFNFAQQIKKVLDEESSERNDGGRIIKNLRGLAYFVKIERAFLKKGNRLYTILDQADSSLVQVQACSRVIHSRRTAP